MKKSLIVILSILVIGVLAFFLSNTLDLQGKFGITSPGVTAVTSCQNTALVDLRQAIRDFEDGLDNLEASLSSTSGLNEDLSEALGAEPDWEGVEDAYDELTGVYDDLSAANSAYKDCSK